MLLFSKKYKGDLKKFLDESMSEINLSWNDSKDNVEKTYSKINNSIEILKNIFGTYLKVGRKSTNGNISGRFNRVLFEVEVFYFSNIPEYVIDDEKKESFLFNFNKLFEKDSDFRSSIESSTKNLENYKIRFTKFQTLINESFNTNLNINPFEMN